MPWHAFISARLCETQAEQKPQRLNDTLQAFVGQRRMLSRHRIKSVCFMQTALRWVASLRLLISRRSGKDRCFDPSGMMG